MNAHERRAWDTLVRLGATVVPLACAASTCSTAALATATALADALLAVVGRSGRNRWHQNRAGQLVYVSTDDETMLHVQNT